MAAVLLNRQAVGYGDAAVAAMSVDGRLFMVFSAFLSDMVRVFSRWQGISLELKIKKVKAGIYFYFMEQHHSGGRNRSGRIPFRTDDHELLLKEDMAAQIGIFTFRSKCLIFR